MRESPLRQGEGVSGPCAAVRLPARGRLLATGDLHDNSAHLRAVIALARLDASPDHHVILHELIHGDRLINGMDFSHRMLLHVAQLVVDYPQQVHPLLANHELSQMTGRGVSKGAGNSVELFRDALEYVYGDEFAQVEAALNAFFRAMPLALVSERPAGGEGGVLCAHSLPDDPLMDRVDVDVLNRPLTEADYERATGSAYLMVWGRRYTEAQVEELAARWGVRLFCLGHQHVETGIEAFGPRVIVLNSDHERATVMPVDLEQVPEAEAALMSAIPLRAVLEGGGHGLG